VNGFEVFAKWKSVQRDGSEDALWLSLFVVGPPLLLATLAVPVFTVGALVRLTRKASSFGLIAAAMWLASFYLCFPLAQAIRMNGMRQMADRSAPRVAAIERYVRDHAEPPPTLDALVPFYLDRIPETGLGAYPKYELLTGSVAVSYERNPWVLMVSTPSGGVNFDVMAYFPLQNYPEVGHGGWWERVGTWAYLHE
jgi:hypothetical protein